MAGADQVPASQDVQRQERQDRLREEAKDAATYRAELEAGGFTRAEALELVQHWQGWRWDGGAP